MGIPVTTPMAKLMAKIFPQKRAERLKWSLPVQRACVLRTTMSSASPIVNWGKR